MPNIKVYPEDHKRLTQLKGELTSAKGKVAYYQDGEKFLLNLYEVVEECGCSHCQWLKEKALKKLDEHEKREKTK